jgi:hypothetical protein
MKLVRFYSKNRVLPKFVHSMTLRDSPAPRAMPRPTRPVVDRGARLRGKVLWWSGIDAWRRASRHIWKVEFMVDGKVLYTDHTWPFSFHRTVGWDSRTVPNGRHMLTVRAYGTHRYRVRKRIPVRVANPPLRLRVVGAVAGGAVQGMLRLGARLNEPVDRVMLYADGKPVSRDSTAPYSLVWDTTAQDEGGHRLVVYARDRHGHRASLDLPVVVANAPTFPDALSRNWVTHHVVVPGTDYVGPGLIE